MKWATITLASCLSQPPYRHIDGS